MKRGTTMWRTLVACYLGKNILLYSPLCHRDHDWPLNKATRILLSITASGLEKPMAVKLGDAYRTADVVNYLGQYE